MTFSLTDDLGDAQDELIGRQLDEFLDALRGGNPLTGGEAGDTEFSELSNLVIRLNRLAQAVATDALGHYDAELGDVFSGVRIGKYELVRLLGRGGQSSALLAFDPDLRRQVVIKLYHAVTSPAEQEIVLREGRALAKLQSPFVAKCYGADRFQGLPYLILEYVPGETLDKLRRERKFSLTRILDLIAKVAEGLSEVHACGLVHRDLKPANIIVDEDGQPRLVDFGLAESVSDPSRQGVSGTPAYMSPEQAQGLVDNIDIRSDVFGVGAVLYELLTGVSPFQAKTRGESLHLARRCQITPPQKICSEVSWRINDLCMRCLAAEPADRFGSMTDLLAAIRSLRKSNRSMLRKPAMLAAFAAVSLAVVIVVGVFAWLHDNDSQARLAPRSAAENTISDPLENAPRVPKENPAKIAPPEPEPTKLEDMQRHFDINGDGHVSPIDVLLIINHVDRKGPYDYRMDVDRNGKIDAHDSQMLGVYVEAHNK